PPKYYFIDFSLSNHYNADDLSAAEPALGGDQMVPEAIADPMIFCNPFAIDSNALRAFLPEVGYTC
ncbi:uncharacterized protein BT62DRAFT_909537, partial [Guyanagaster necrorhizus]